MSEEVERGRRAGSRRDYLALSKGLVPRTMSVVDESIADPSAESQHEENESDDESDFEMRSMKAELERVKGEKKQLVREHKKLELASQLQKEKVELSKLQSKGTKPKVSASASGGLFGQSKSDSKVTIGHLRGMSSLNRVVSGQMRALGLDDSDSSSSSSSSDFVSDTSKKHRKSKKHKSGITAKASDRVKAPQIWPHSTLQVTHVSKAVTFEDLSFSMFVAGETEILSNHVSSEIEMVGRLSMLRQIAYYKDTYDWKSLLDLYAAWLRQIELGQRKWLDDTTQLEHVILAGHKQSTQQTSSPRPNKSGVNQSKFTRESKSGDDSVWYCSAFQRNKCSEQNAHIMVINGQMRHVHHICATCWQKDGEKLAHAESSSDCPHQV
jgi:hypothetical protein